MKIILSIRRYFALATALFVMLGGLIGNIFNDIPEDTYDSYISRIAQRDVYENTIATAIPQTAIAGIVATHFISPLPDGKTEKKAIIIGYDGSRADSIDLTYENSAVKKLLGDGGHAYLSYCGGVPYPLENTQDTSTAPGWCSILTGTWATVNGVTGNDIPKDNANGLTLLTTLVESKIIDSSAFYTMWPGHFVDENSTYINEKKYCEDKNLNVEFCRCLFDLPTFSKTLSDIRSDDCSDFIFTILEGPDATGHASGFSPDNPLYRFGTEMNEVLASSLIDEIELRDTYDTEDWLIIITSDHGGINTGHGGSSIQERMTITVINKEVLF